MANDDHLMALEADVNHVKGEANGCVTNCVYVTVKEGKKEKYVCQFDGHDYRENGYEYTIGKDDEKSWYNIDLTTGPKLALFVNLYGGGKHPSPYKKKSPTDEKELWWIGGSSGQCSSSNYKNSYWPWPNEAHHIIPVLEGLHKRFELDELRLLLEAKYNVNRGPNIIILPCRKRLATLYELPSHWYHSTYSMNVRKKLKSIKQTLAQAQSDDEEGHPEVTKENKENVAKELESFSEDMRKQIRNYGVKNAGGRINDVPVR